ncbi:bile acid:sodium symporter family protein [Flammeovirgaceae bacterium SG7u.111]|nr:bile acid:sodium symporter family protein [Flammeovirgaceae bacterium SG7u.132]WPO36178.1 bile acid:sodium symporter family protein [Flammeovirgaceae bacterium SG7u.111]
MEREGDVLEGVRLEFNDGNLLLLNLSIALIMFGVALSLKKENFLDVVKHPRAVLTGIVSQFILLPIVTFLLVWFSDPLPGLALGMILVAACPGGNLSNFFSFLGKGNVALSISLTTVASLAAIIFTPLNLQFWGSILGSTNSLLRKVDIEFVEMFQTVAMIIAVPLILGVFVNEKFPRISALIQKPLKYISVLILVAILVIAFTKNYNLFLQYYHYIIMLVVFHNGLALATGYLFSKIVGNSSQDTRSITIETGIQNSGLGLVIIFTFFDGQGGMALITAWWGIWHIISGFAISQFFAYRVALKEQKLVIGS